MSDYPKQPNKPELHGYKLQLAMGEGGTGTVYRALNPETGEVVALKEFHANFFRGKSHLRDLTKMVKRFQKLEHPNVARIIELINEDDHVALILEFVDGPDLKWYLENRPWNLQERLVILAQICNGLSYLHDHKFVHHDLKPANVLFTRQGQVKLCDFSLAGANTGLMAIFDGGVVEQVTPMYVAPELIRKEKPTKLVDMYSLGVIMYIMFADHVPFQVDDLQKLYACHLNQVPVHPSDENPECPRKLGDITMKLLAKKPEARYQDCQELRIALSEIGQSRI
jgi:eukaryotic-like serine/threonine-protein kinase